MFLHRQARELAKPEQKAQGYQPKTLGDINQRHWHHPKMPMGARQTTEIEEADSG